MRAARRRRRCSTSPRRWCAGWRRSCRSRPRRSGGTCPGQRAASRCSSTTWHELPAGAASRRDRLGRADRAAPGCARELERLRGPARSARRWRRRWMSTALPRSTQRLAALGDELRFLTITSAARVHARAADAAGGAVPAGIAPAAACGCACGARARTKCVRCWHHRDDVGSDPAHPELCGRCAGNIGGDRRGPALCLRSLRSMARSRAAALAAGSAPC